MAFTRTCKPYHVDWRDRCRDAANAFFLSSFILLLWEYVLPGAICAIIAEILLTPHTLKCRSWTTGTISVIFVAASLLRLFSM